jgi:multisubunit Na+/H+ antiporter MnhF subunit
MIFYLEIFLLTIALVIMAFGFRSKNIASRMLSFNCISAYIICAVAIISFELNEADYLDIALIYAVIGFISSYIFLQYIKDKIR